MRNLKKKTAVATPDWPSLRINEGLNSLLVTILRMNKFILISMLHSAMGI